MYCTVLYVLSSSLLSSVSDYFIKWYCNRVEQWAYSYRIGTPANTNMVVEAFHRYLKVVYLEGKHHRRVDHLVFTLLRIARDKVYERAIKIEKGRCTHRICEINKRHKSAVIMVGKKTAIMKTSESSWTVQSSSRTGLFYTVSRDTSVQECNLVTLWFLCSLCTYVQLHMC